LTATAEHRLNADEAAERIDAFLKRCGPVTVLGGAGISTASGIPDYRDADGNWKNASPMQFSQFTGSEAARRRYWARSYAGWKHIEGARPNDAHRAIAGLEQAGRIAGVIAQNVDGLHNRAGSERVIDLHGRLDRVICLECHTPLDRKRWQAMLETANPGWSADVDYYKPDGDAELTADKVARFNVPECPACGGTMKPDVVFFGENVPKPRVDAAMNMLDTSSGLWVIGSSMMVFSGFRFARRAAETEKPIAILNRGRTRGDDLATLKVDTELVEVLARVAALA